ncbi:MAG TPA: hypothetical protein EYP85_06910, partial [Armatimonadetes bacterium]|nr:hypothetical protein [Armatimonadota bacterium]
MTSLIMRWSLLMGLLTLMLAPPSPLHGDCPLPSPQTGRTREGPPASKGREKVGEPMGEGRWVKLEHAPTYTRWLVRFDSPQPSGQPRNDRVWVEGYRPRSSEPVPVVLVLHSWRSRRGETGRRLCRALAQRGIAAFLVVLPYHLQRTPPGAKSGDLMISSDLARTRAAFMQAVADVRATATLLQRQPWVDGQRLGLVGLSLGAIIGSLVVERDQRFRAVVLLFAGGDLGTLLWKSVILRPLRRRLQREGFTRAAIRVALREVDPLTTASAGRPRHLLMINGKYDWVMPRECVEALWRAWGKPELVWLNGGHYS